jgi:hypothetical protein
MAKKISTTIECLLNRKVEPINGKWYNEEETIMTEVLQKYSTST